jgi:hypothetical protein
VFAKPIPLVLFRTKDSPRTPLDQLLPPSPRALTLTR